MKCELGRLRPGFHPFKALMKIRLPWSKALHGQMAFGSDTMWLPDVRDRACGRRPGVLLNIVRAAPERGL